MTAGCRHNNSTGIVFIAAAIVTAVLFIVDLMVGDTRIGPREVLDVLFGEAPDALSRTIVMDIRMIKAIVALLGGTALAVSGLQMQVLFRNPLAGPYVLGISSGASLGVALFILGAPLLGLTWLADNPFGIAGAAWVGSAGMLLITGWIGTRFNDIMVVLILGMLFSSGIGAVVQILQYLSSDESLKAFVIWTMGSLGEVTRSQLWVMVPSIVMGCLLAVLAIKPLNLLLMGEDYAVTMGLDRRRARSLLFLSTTLLAGTTTAFCGPLGFIGMAMPHVARFLFGRSDNRVLVPAVMLVGAATLLLCDIVAKYFIVPINTITALLGIPLVAWIVLGSKLKMDR